APLPPLQRADVDRHAQSIALVVARAAHLRMVPGLAQILRAPRHVGFESATAEDHRLRGERLEAVRPTGDDAGHASLRILLEADGAGAIADLDIVLLGRFEPVFREADAFVLGADDGALRPFDDVADAHAARSEERRVGRV